MPCSKTISVQGAVVRRAPCQWWLLHLSSSSSSSSIQWLSSPSPPVSFRLFLSHPVSLWPSAINYMTQCQGRDSLEQYQLWLEGHSTRVSLLETCCFSIKIYYPLFLEHRLRASYLMHVCLQAELHRTRLCALTSNKSGAVRSWEQRMRDEDAEKRLWR